MYIELKNTQTLLTIEAFKIAKYLNYIIIYNLDRNYFLTKDEILFKEQYNQNKNLVNFLINHNKTPQPLKDLLILRNNSNIGQYFEVLTNNEMDIFVDKKMPLNLAHFYGLKTIKTIKIKCIKEFSSYKEFLNDKNTELQIYGFFNFEKNKIEFSSLSKNKNSLLLILNDFNHTKLKSCSLYLKFEILLEEK